MTANNGGVVVRRVVGLVPVLAVVLLLPSCKAVREKYFNALEKVGIEKRELLVSRVDNARALGSLSGTFKSLQVEVDGLITQMQGSIAEADTFIQEMRTAPKQ